MAIEKTVIPVPTSKKPFETNISNDASFEELIAARNPMVIVNELGAPDIPSFVTIFDKSTLSTLQKNELVDATKADIEWVKRKLASKLRKPMWQDENSPQSKEKLIRMFNKYVQKRLDLLLSLGEHF